MKSVLQEKSQGLKSYSLCLIEDASEIGNWLINKLSMNERISSFYWAKNYQESEKYIYREKPEVIILDLKLPDGNGIDILRTIRKENLDIKVFVFSSNTALKNACQRLGATHFFDKSYDSEKLIEALEYLTI